MTMIPVLLSGGSGHRLWPLSRELYPKQLIRLTGEHSLLQQAAIRAQQVSSEAPLVISNYQHRFMVALQLQQVGIENANIILEPIGRNTAPAIALAALQVMERDPEALMLVLPADHLVNPVTVFSEAIAEAQAVAEHEYIVTFGVEPTAPQTGYGYIERGDVLEHGGFRVARFTEKPDKPTAEQYLETGRYYWNSGMFLCRASLYLAELQRHAPAMFSVCEKTFLQRQKDLNFITLPAETFIACPKDSIDYAVMEKTDRAAVVSLNCSWHDVGAWSALHAIEQADDQGNVFKGDVVAKDTTGCYIRSDERLVATLGVKDHIIVDTKDALLVAHRDRSEDVKQLVTALQEAQRPEVTTHQRVYRPWGYYDVLVQHLHFQVKRICVYPGAALSLQMHYHRSEHWVVVSGVAEVVRGEETFTLKKNQSTYIEVETKHRLSNRESELLEIIEVQSGDYLGEDDIVRFEDHYARV